MRHIEWAYSSAGEHYIDIVGVTGSIPVTPTIRTPSLKFSITFKRLDAFRLLASSQAHHPVQAFPGLRNIYLFADTTQIFRNKIASAALKRPETCV